MPDTEAESFRDDIEPLRDDTGTHEEVEREIRTGGFDGYRMLGVRWMGGGDDER